MVAYLATPTINYRRYGKRRAPRRSCRVLREFGLYGVVFIVRSESKQKD